MCLLHLSCCDLDVVSQMLYALGDVRNPDPATVSLVESIIIDFIGALASECISVYGSALYTHREAINHKAFFFTLRKRLPLFNRARHLWRTKEQQADVSSSIAGEHSSKKKKKRKD
jgi:hypothetical protein